MSMFAMFGTSDNVSPIDAPVDIPKTTAVGDPTMRGGFASPLFKTGARSASGTVGTGQQHILLLPGTIPFNGISAAGLKQKGVNVYDMDNDTRNEALLPGNRHQCHPDAVGCSHILSPTMVGSYFGDSRNPETQLMDIWDNTFLRRVYPHMFKDASTSCFAREARIAWTSFWKAKKESWVENPKITNLVEKTAIVFYGIQLQSPDKMAETPTIFKLKLSSSPKDSGLGRLFRDACQAVSTPQRDATGEVTGPAVAKALINVRDPSAMYAYSFQKYCPPNSTNRMRDTTYSAALLVPKTGVSFTQALATAGWNPGAFDELLHKYMMYIAANPLFTQFAFISEEEQLQAVNTYAARFGYEFSPNGRGGCTVIPVTNGIGSAYTLPPQAKAPAATEVVVSNTEALLTGWKNGTGARALQAKTSLEDVLMDPYTLAFSAKADLSGILPTLLTWLVGGDIAEDAIPGFTEQFTVIFRDFGRAPNETTRDNLMGALLVPEQPEITANITKLISAAVSAYWDAM